MEKLFKDLAEAVAEGPVSRIFACLTGAFFVGATWAINAWGSLAGFSLYALPAFTFSFWIYFSTKSKAEGQKVLTELNELKRAQVEMFALNAANETVRQQALPQRLNQGTTLQVLDAEAMPSGELKVTMRPFSFAPGATFRLLRAEIQGKPAVTLPALLQLDFGEGDQFVLVWRDWPTKDLSPVVSLQFEVRDGNISTDNRQGNRMIRCNVRQV